MSHTKHILIIGGDKRYITMIHSLAKQVLQLHIVGFKDVDFSHANIYSHHLLDTVPVKEIDAILLPVAGCDSNGAIALSLPKGEITLTSEFLLQTKSTCTIYSGIASPYLKTLTRQTNRKLVDFFSRDDIAIANSIPTAEGALEIAMKETDITIHGANVLVTGFGRVGITTARLFHQVGANVTVSARKTADFERIKEMRLTPIHHNTLANTAHIDIFINTVPFLLINETIIRQMKASALIIDLASAPGGVDFEAAEEQGIHAIHALALPGYVASKKAGEIIAEIIVHLLELENN